MEMIKQSQEVRCEHAPLRREMHVNLELLSFGSACDSSPRVRGCHRRVDTLIETTERADISGRRRLFPNSHAMGSCKTNRRTGAVGSPSELVGGWCPGHVLMASGSCDAGVPVMF